jgi:hypothetical protein
MNGRHVAAFVKNDDPQIFIFDEARAATQVQALWHLHSSVNKTQSGFRDLRLSSSASWFPF